MLLPYALVALDAGAGGFGAGPEGFVGNSHYTNLRPAVSLG